MDVQQIKQRFGIIGNTNGLVRNIEIAIQVAPTDLTVLISGESGTGKETFPKIIHQFSSRKHGAYIAVNCGAIPEGTIDSELFGHEKGSFTGATDSRKGYFEVADNGTIFLDEVAELPLSTQVRLLRVLESGEFIRVGSSKAMKTNVRVVAASNVNMVKAVDEGRFREDLYYRLNTVPIMVPPLRERKEDVYMLFRKFATDFAEKFKMPALTLTTEAREMLENYRWPGNIRLLKNITEQISILEQNREVSAGTLKKYLPISEGSKLPALYKRIDEQTFNSEREILYKVLFDMKSDMSDLKRLVHDLMSQGVEKTHQNEDHARIIKNLYDDTKLSYTQPNEKATSVFINQEEEASAQIQDTEEFIEESLSLSDKEKEMIIKALEKHNGKRKNAADDLGISERTLYRKIKEYDIDL
ncbi:MAG: sigma-54 dependent transcriptional regulator [Salinivirgaceae bacterium]